MIKKVMNLIVPDEYRDEFDKLLFGVFIAFIFVLIFGLAGGIEMGTLF